MSKEQSASSENPDIHEFFAADPVAADRAFFGRESCLDRRGFLRGAGLAAMAAMVGAAIPFHRNMPAGLIPAAFAEESMLVGKDGLTLLNKRPMNAETPPHLLDDPITPTSRHFIRNNGVPPAETSADAWTFTVGRDAAVTYSHTRKVFTRVANRAGLTDVCLQDLRRGFMTSAAASGIGTHVLRDLLGHKTTAMADRYIRAVGDPVREARVRVGAAMAEAMIVTQDRASV